MKFEITLKRNGEKDTEFVSTIREMHDRLGELRRTGAEITNVSRYLVG